MAFIIFDGDDTLWSGLILHGDPVQLREGIPEVCKELTKRGHQLCIVSRNERANLLDYVQRLGLGAYFADKNIYADWGPKAPHVSTILGLAPGPVQPGSVLFVDDDAFNRAEIEAAFPGVATVHCPDALDLLDHPVAARQATAEDRRRIGLLREQRQRELAAKAYDGSFQAFLKSCDLRLTLYPYRALIPDEQRALDLLNRTTELRTDQQTYLNLPDTCYAASLVDRFGDYGLIAIGVYQPDNPRLVSSITLLDLAVSCRTMGRGVGAAMITWLCRKAAFLKLGAVQGILTQSERNGPMKDLYRFLGFREGASQVDGKACWIWEPKQDAPPPFPEWITLQEVEG